MKVALILASNTCYAPHIFHYVRILKEKNIDFDLIIWNKDNVVEKDCISYDSFIDLSKFRLSRITSYLGYAGFVTKVLKKNKYKRIIVFTVFLGVLILPYLRKNFKRMYFFDIRDYSPILGLFPWMTKPLIKDSFATTISSPGFLKWLPSSTKYVISHNYRFEENVSFNIPNYNSEKKRTILTIGFLRDFEINKIILDSFKNNEGFLIKFVGRGIAYEPLMNFAQINNIQNVIFTGGYDKKDEIEYLKNASLINILLGDDLNSSTLMTNRLYLAISNGIPIMVNNNSMQGEYVHKYNLGIVIDNRENIAVEVIKYFQNFDRNKFQKGCEQFLSDIEADQNMLEKKIEDFIID
jgi:hypothetical protein